MTRGKSRRNIWNTTIPLSSELDRSKYCFRIIDLSLSIPLIAHTLWVRFPAVLDFRLRGMSSSQNQRRFVRTMRKCVIGLRELAFVLVAFSAGLNLVSLNVAGQQITGSIRGTVLDPSGAVVQTATVTAKHIENWLNSCSGYGSSGSVRAGRTPDRTLSGRGPCARFPEVPAARNLIGCQRDCDRQHSPQSRGGDAAS